MITREGKTGLGTYTYDKARFTMTRMSDDNWYIFENGCDTGKTFTTLKAARQWASQQDK